MLLQLMFCLLSLSSQSVNGSMYDLFDAVPNGGPLQGNLYGITTEGFFLWLASWFNETLCIGKGEFGMSFVYGEMTLGIGDKLQSSSRW